MISAGMGISIVPEMTMKRHPDDNITYLQVCESEPERFVAILRRKAGAMTTAAKAFLNYSREQMISVHKSL
jgi:DNA-binding transcriptional LysR family regulator